METEFLILGAGVTGLAAGVELEKSAIILEKENRPGGLVRSHCFNGNYWFDHVLHLLHFKDKAIQSRIESLLGPILKPCPPIAWIECKEGNVLYPFQLNLGGLNEDARNRCISDYAKVYFQKNGHKKELNYKEYLKETFGDAMSEIFYFPYNTKLYKYPLDKIAVEEIVWNLHRPSFEEILQGGFQPNILRVTYNTNAFYPQPPKGSRLRGMEVLSQALAKRTYNLKLNSTVTSIDLKSKTAWTLNEGVKKKFVFHDQCLSTIPLTQLMHLCSDVPGSLLKEVNQLEYTKVFSVALCIKGDRPKNTGHWRYYTDPELPFTRLIFMTEFDPYCAPPDGWGLLAEITWNHRGPEPDKKVLIEEIITALKKISLIDDQSTIIGKHIWTADPAYVIFTFDTERIVNNCFEFLEKYGVTCLGRYGKWEYSSMYQNIKAGFDWAAKVTSKYVV